MKAALSLFTAGAGALDMAAWRKLKALGAVTCTTASACCR